MPYTDPGVVPFKKGAVTAHEDDFIGLEAIRTGIPIMTLRSFFTSDLNGE
jgi:hypothetical protein